MALSNFSFPSESSTLLSLLQSSARSADIEAYLVGGYIRDLYMGRTSKDIDITCIGADSGPRLAQLAQKQLGAEASCTLFRRFGTAQLKYRGYVVEFVTARRESYRSSSRNPIVEAGDA